MTADATVTDTDNNWIDRDVLRLAGTLLQVARELDHEVRRASPNEPLSMADLSVLRQIERGRNLPSLVARSLRLDPGRVTRITDNLVSLGYVSRTEDQVDRRRCRLELTPPGLARLRVGQREVSVAMHRLLEGLSEDERQGLTAGLEGARRVLEAQP